MENDFCLVRISEIDEHRFEVAIAILCRVMSVIYGSIGVKL